VIVGDGPLRADLEARARRLGLSPRCRFVGTRTDLGDLLAALDLLVVPSRSEGLPYVVLEAMLAGTPLIVTEVGGIPEVLIDGVHGVLVPSRAPARLAQAITRCMAEPEGTRARAASARRHAEARFSLRAMLAAVDAVYAAVLAEGAGRARLATRVVAE
jgi:glycosyltransferase involved in cell wall biosynthesis